MTVRGEKSSEVKYKVRSTNVVKFGLNQNHRAEMELRMPESALQTVSEATVMAKLLHAAGAWWGFTSASDRQRIEAFVSRANRCGFCRTDQPSVSQLVQHADEKLFKSVLNNPLHTVHKLLPNRRHKLTYTLRPMQHNLILSCRSHRLSE